MFNTPTVGTVEYQVQKDFGMEFLPFVKQCKDQGLDICEAAEMIGCSVSNFRRIMRKYNFSLYIPESEPMINSCPKFQNKRMNAVNYLSKRWVT
jgi:hypothetical protein